DGSAVSATRAPSDESLARIVATRWRLEELFEFDELCGRVIRLCETASVKNESTVTAHQSNFKHWWRREDRCCLFMTWGGIKRKPKPNCRRNYATSPHRCHSRLKPWRVRCPACRATRERWCALLRAGLPRRRPREQRRLLARRRHFVMCEWPPI